MIAIASRLKTIAICASSLLLASCASLDGEPGERGEVNAANPLVTADPANIRVPMSHSEAIRRNSAGDSQFAGLYATFELKATILNTPVREALIRRQAEYYQWDSAQQTSEREKALQELNSQTEIFLSFSTPERKNDNLADKKSIWRIFSMSADAATSDRPKKINV